MQLSPIPLPPALKRLAAALPAPLYLVGGTVRDALMGKESHAPDYDLSSPVEEEVFSAAAEGCGFTVRAVFRRTGTVKLACGENGFEFTRFRSDTYVRGLHRPEEISFTEDIGVDARRRDFCANAVYYDVAADSYLDPLGGIKDIKAGRLRTVRDPDLVFGEDGLRLFRLCRLSAETGLLPDGPCRLGAARNAALLADIAPERLFEELRRLLLADGRGGDPYRGLRLMDEIGLFPILLPELAAGKGLAQPSAFHKYDVLEHSLRTVKYAPPSIRFAALLHDVGKPYCFFRDGNFYAHAEEGARIAEEILSRLRAPKALVRDTSLLVGMHMLDYNGLMREGKVRRYLARSGPLLPDLLALKQADYSACKDDLSPAPVVVKWQGVLLKMKQEGAPLTLRDLAVDGNDLRAAGVPPREISAALDRLFDECLLGARNERSALLARVSKYLQEKRQ